MRVRPEDITSPKNWIDDIHEEFAKCGTPYHPRVSFVLYRLSHILCMNPTI